MLCDNLLTPKDQRKEEKRKRKETTFRCAVVAFTWEPVEI